ncbi:phosphatidylinositol 3-kinase regulatory subunit alpha-like isoform X2 [Babylonia areolata]
MPGDFTLYVRKDGCNRSVRIYRQKKGYSLSPAQSSSLFYTLAELVDYYRTHSLASCNKRLGVHLHHPVCKPAAARSSQYHVFKELYDLGHEQHKAQNRLSLLQQQRGQLDTKLRMLDLKIPALKQVQEIYYENMVLQADWEAALCKEHTPRAERGVSVRWLHRERSVLFRNTRHPIPQPHPRTSEVMGAQTGPGSDTGKEGEEGEEGLDLHGMTPSEKKRWTDNAALVLSRHKAVSSRLEELKMQSRACAFTLRGLDSDIQYVELSLVNMKNKTHELIRYMVELGCQKEFVCKVLELPQQEMPEFDTGTWLVECSQEEAVARLEVLPHGAFLVRQKDYPHFPYSLSVVVRKDDTSPAKVHHCFIVRPHGRGLGFNAALAVFQSIADLVLRHRHVSLRHYFSELDVTLSFPVGCQEMLRRSLEVERLNSGEGEETCARAGAVK